MGKSRQMAMPINKYGNVRVYYDSLTGKASSDKPLAGAAETLIFDSQLEFNLYKILLTKFDKSDIKLHHKIEILPLYLDVPAITWRIDFKVETESHLFYVEAKGIELDDYKLKCNLLARFHPSIYDRIFTIHDKELSTFKHTIATFPFWEDKVRK
jgi:hypothetical protein